LDHLATSPPESPDELYWSWPDAALFLGLLVPSGFLAFGIMRGFTMLIRMGSAAQVLSFQFIGYGIWLTTLYLLLWLRYRRPFWASMGWRVPWPGVVPSIFYGPLLAVFIAVTAAALKTPPGSTIQDLMRDRLSIALIGLFSFTLGPLCEELVFRGFFQPLLIRTFGVPLGILLCAVPFALLHGPQYHWSWQVVVLLVLAGATFGYTRLRTGSTAASTLVHATYNLTFFMGYLLQRKELTF
jgi:uncharacterized protein